MAMSKNYLSKILHLQGGLQSMTLRPKSTTKTSPSAQEEQSQPTRPKRPMASYARFFNKTWGKDLSQLWKDAAKSWKELSEEEKRPFVDRYNAELKVWQEKRDIFITEMEEGDQSGGKGNRSFNGRMLFTSEVQIPGASFDFIVKALKMWNELTPEEKEVYNERARKINEEGQGNLLKSTIKNVKSHGRPKTAYIEFASKFVSQTMKEAHSDMMRKWSELSDEEKEKYVKASEEEFEAYNAQLQKYKRGEKFTEDKRNRKVLVDKIKEIEEEMKMPKLLASSGYAIFIKEKREYFKGKKASDSNVARLNCNAMWQALDEEGKTEYRERWHKLKFDWQQEVAKWEARNTDNPKMTELRTYKNMLHPHTKQKTI